MVTRRTAASRVTSLASAPLLGLAVLVMLTVAGCGTATSSAASSSGTKTPASAAPTVTRTPVTPVAPGAPPGSGGTVSGYPSCTDWPARVASGPLPASFQPVAVIRCVTGYQTIPGHRLRAAVHRPVRLRPGVVAELRVRLRQRVTASLRTR